MGKYPHIIGTTKKESEEPILFVSEPGEINQISWDTLNAATTNKIPAYLERIELRKKKRRYIAIIAWIFAYFLSLLGFIFFLLKTM